MIHIMIDEYANGYGIKAYDSKKPGFFIDETIEERLEMLHRVERWLRDEIIAELERRQQYAGQS